MQELPHKAQPPAELNHNQVQCCFENLRWMVQIAYSPKQDEERKLFAVFHVFTKYILQDFVRIKTVGDKKN